MVIFELDPPPSWHDMLLLTPETSVAVPLICISTISSVYPKIPTYHFSNDPPRHSPPQWL